MAKPENGEHSTIPPSPYLSLSLSLSRPTKYISALLVGPPLLCQAFRTNYSIKRNTLFQRHTHILYAYIDHMHNQKSKMSTNGVSADYRL